MADEWVARLDKLIEPLQVKPGSKVTLRKDFDPGYKADFVRKKDAHDFLQTGVTLLAEYQARLAAVASRGVLVVLQAIDAGGKDGTIRHVMSGVNPQGVYVSSFKVPSTEEMRHGYLWRYVQRLPGRGDIAVFNRSHYEEVLVVRVHPENLDRQKLPAADRGRKLWQRRYREINDWERYLSDNGFSIVKLLLNLSKEEQRVRFLKRIDDPDRKWFARICASAAIVHTLAALNPQYPEVSKDIRRELQAAKRELEAEAPAGQPADPNEAARCR